MVGPLENNELLITELLKAIAHFIERQKLVAQAMRDLDIDLDDVGKFGAAVWSQQGVREPLSSLPVLASDEGKELWEAVRRARSKEPVTQQGVWGDSDEWIYFLHGKGCRLRNILTGEVIDWNCPNAKAFDPYSFLDHLHWRLETEGESILPRIKEWVSRSPDGSESIIQIIKQMKENGLINPDWTLAKDAPTEHVIGHIV